MISNDRKKFKGVEILIQSSYIGALRGIVGLPFEHPFDAIKTNMQSLSKKTFETIHQIYSSKGIVGFYSGFLVNTFRVMSKQIYRWPLMIGLTNFYQGSLGITQLNSSALTGLSMAMFEAGILCPFERIKIWLMTSATNQKVRNFLKSNDLKSIFQGFTPVFLKQTLSWVTFLTSTTYFKELFKKHWNTDRLNQIQIFYVSILVSLVNTGFVMPIDYVKTQFQKKESDHNSSMKKIIVTRFQNTGLKGFYVGWQAKIIQYTINSVFTVGIFEKLLNDYKKSQ